MSVQSLALGGPLSPLERELIRKGIGAASEEGGLTAADEAAVRALAGDGVQQPTANVVAAAGGAGVLTGTYYYGIAYRTAAGVTDPWPGTASAVILASNRSSLTSIPIGPSGVIGRVLLRTVANPVDPKDYFVLAEISDNTTTTYLDNAADGTLTVPAKWLAENRGVVSDGVNALASFAGQSVAMGQQANGAGYASTAVGFQALTANTRGRRNVAIGTYALAALTTGYQNTGIGVHAGNGIVGALGNTFLGYAAGGITTAPNNFNVAVGTEAFTGSGSTTGTGNVAVGYRALGSINTADSCIGIGYFAGCYANASRQVFIDTSDRTNITNAQNIGLIYGKGEGTAAAQVLHLNAQTRIGAGNAPVVAGLPTAATSLRGYRGYVTDASVAYTSANVGSTVAGGGANVVPVFCTGAAWVIG